MRPPPSPSLPGIEQDDRPHSGHNQSKVKDSNRMNIGITCYPTYGGSGVVATELGKELASRGHQVHFISYAFPIRLTLSERIYFHEVEVRTYPLFEYPPYD